MSYLLAVLFLAVAGFLARFNLFRTPKKGIVVLLYHRIDNKPTHTSLDKFSISKDILEKQITFLQKKGFISILPDEIENIAKKELWKQNKYVLITFDDGYKDNLKAAEILKRHSMKGLFFISTAYIGKQMNSVAMLDEKDIKQLISYGMQIGSHSHNHKKLAELTELEIKREIETSLRILSNFCDVADFAYPFGSHDDRVINILKQSGIKRAYIIGQKIYQIEGYSNYKIPRVIVRKNTNILDFYLLITRGRSRF